MSSDSEFVNAWNLHVDIVNASKEPLALTTTRGEQKIYCRDLSLRGCPMNNRGSWEHIGCVLRDLGKEASESDLGRLWQFLKWNEQGGVTDVDGYDAMLFFSGGGGCQGASETCEGLFDGEGDGYLRCRDYVNNRCASVGMDATHEVSFDGLLDKLSLASGWEHGTSDLKFAIMNKHIYIINNPFFDQHAE